MSKGAISRITDIVRADVNDLLTKMEMEEAIGDAVGAVGKAIAHQRWLERKIEEVQNQVESWEKKTAKAVQANEEDLACRALHQKLNAETETAELGRSLADARQVAESLRKQLARLKTKLQTARSKQYSVVQSRIGAHEFSRNRPSLDERAFKRFDDLCERVSRAEAEVEEMEGLAGKDPELDKSFRDLETKERVDAELAAMKAKQNPVAGQ